jgi:hypothetical protein
VSAAFFAPSKGVSPPPPPPPQLIKKKTVEIKRQYKPTRFNENLIARNEESHTPSKRLKMDLLF